MVRGPMIAEVTPGWLIAQASASSINVMPDFSASCASSSTTSSLRWFARVLMSKRAPGRAADVGVPGAPLRHRPVSQPPDSGLYTRVPMPWRCTVGKHVLLDTADQDRVRGLLGDEPGQVPLTG